MPMNWLQYQQQPAQPMSPQQALSLQSIVMEQDQIRDKVQRQQAERQILGSPDAIDRTTGAPTLATIAKLYQVNPEAATQMSHQRQVTLQQVAQMQATQLDKKMKQRTEAEKIAAQAVSAYRETMQRTGGNQQEAMREATRVRNEGWNELWTSGIASGVGFTDEQRDQFISAPFDLNKALALVTKPGEVASRESQTETPFQRDLKASLAARGLKPGTPEYQKAFSEAMAKRTARETAPTASMTSGEAFEGKNGELMAALAERGVSLPAGFRSSQQQLGLLRGLIKRNPNLTADQIAEKVKSGVIDLSNEKTWGRVAAATGGKVAYAENEIKQTVPLALEAMKSVPRDKFVPWNRLKQYKEEQFSDPDLAEFRTYMTSLSNAYDMLAARGGTDMEKRKENRRMFDTAQSPEALERVMQAVIKEAEASGRAARQSLRPTERGVEKKAPPAVGTVQGGYRYKGGDPAKQENWEKVS